jgi:hypothetical protein
MNFLQLQQRLARRRGAADGTLVTATATRYKDALNEVHRALLRQPGMEPLRYALMTVASVAGQQAYAVPAQGVARINRIWETTNDRKLEYRTLDWLRRVDPNPQQGTPWAWIPTGYVEVHTQPSNASEIFVKSSAAGDTTQTAYIEGFITGGYYRTASVTLTGTTAVSLSAAITSFIQITKFYLSAAAAGTVTLHEDSGAGTELARIAIGDVRAQFYAFLLYDTPSAVVTYSLDVLRAIPDMSNDTDEPLIPEDFHDLLIDKAERKELRKQDDPNRMVMLDRDIAAAESELRSFITNHPDWRPQFGGPTEERSRLGGWFPADSRLG